MSVYQTVIALIVGVAVVFAFYERNRREEKIQTEALKRGRKTAFVEPLLLPILLAVLSVALLITGGGLFPAAVIAEGILLFLYISIYYAVLLILLPLLRRIISARACATLWIVPAMLYFSIYLSGHEATPLIVITLPRRWLSVFTWIWAAGFAGVVIWQLTSHFSYRRFLLKSAEEVTDNRILSLWYNASDRHGIKAEIPVLVSEEVSTPLSIGCFDRTMRLILPGQSYTDEELDLIFCHELRHILRADMRTKLFIGFCAAVCWFNPLAWIARRKAADDLELSCDEAILVSADETTRRLYAELLLKNAGSGRGYTTCLSVSASSLRYRLRNIISPAKRLSGGVFIGIALFGLLMTIGTVSLADSSGTVQSLVFDKAPQGMTIDWVTACDEWSEESVGYRSVYEWKEEALTDYLASLRVKQVYAGNYEKKDPRLFLVEYKKLVDGDLMDRRLFELCDGLMFVKSRYNAFEEITFILEDELDWDYINSLLDFDTKNPDPAPVPPEMMMDFGEPINENGNLMHASKTILSAKRGDAEQGINEYLNDEGVGGVFGFPVTQVKLYFSYAPEGVYTVVVEDWERTASYTVSSGELADDALPLAPYSAHYTVYGTFTTVRDTTYEMKFVFDIELPEGETDSYDSSP